MKRFAILWLVLALAFSACRARPATLNVFAAASLADAFREIGQDFETANPGVIVTFNFAGSQTLRTQIEQGAQADIFAPANLKEMDALVNGGFVAADALQIFSQNRLVVILPGENPASLENLSDLTRDGVKVILAAKEVPAGAYSLEALARLEPGLGSGFKDRVLANVVSYENDVRQVAAKIQLGEADAGIVYLSDAVAVEGLKTIPIPDESNVLAQYPLSMLKNSPNPELARTFIDYVLSADGQAVLAKWGFSPVK
jgi:molybdate transport system substrate-binding protein